MKYKRLIDTVNSCAFITQDGSIAKNLLRPPLLPLFAAFAA